MGMWGRLRGLLIAVCVTGLIASACQRAVERQDLAKEDVSELKHLNVSVIGGSLSYFPVFAADSKGFFRKEGIDVEIIRHQSGVQIRDSLFGGATDIAALGLIHVFRGAEEGLDAKVIAPILERSVMVLMVRNSMRDEVKSVKDLKGRRVGVDREGSGLWVFLVRALRNNGVDPQEVLVVGLGTPGLEPALEKGEVDAIVTTAPNDAELIERQIGYVLIDPLQSKEAHRAVFGSEFDAALNWVARGDWLAKNGDLAKRFLRAMERTYAFVKNGTKVSNILQAVAGEFGDLPKPIAEVSMTRIVRAMPEHAQMSHAAFESSLRILIESQIVQKDAHSYENSVWTPVESRKDSRK